MRYTRSGLTRQILNIMTLSIVMLAVTITSLPMKSYANTNTIEAIKGYYQKYLNRPPDELGLNYWVGQVIKHGKKLAEIEQAIQNSDEAKIRGFYLLYLKHEPDKANMNYWLNQIAYDGKTLTFIENAIKNTFKTSGNVLVNKSAQSTVVRITAPDQNWNFGVTCPTVLVTNTSRTVLQECKNFSWVTVTRNGNDLLVTLTENTSSNSRYAQVTVVYGGVLRKFLITQNTHLTPPTIDLFRNLIEVW